jgi:hypothetical protein
MHSKHLNLRFVQSQAAVMASSTTIPAAATDHFDLGIHTRVNLNRGARAALLQNSPAAVNGTIGVFTWTRSDGPDTILTTQLRHHRCSYGRS